MSEMKNRAKRSAHVCIACTNHPHSAIAKYHRAINRVLAPLEEQNRRRFVGLLALEWGFGRETLRRLLRDFGYKLRSNRKRLTRKQDPERDRQFRYITRQRGAFRKAGRPVISIDAKKKELVGNFKQAGRAWRQAPLDVLEKDYPNLAEGKAIPYGIYDMQANEGMIIVGISAETAQFAVAAIRRW